MIPGIDPDLAARLAALVERVDPFSVAAWNVDDVAPVMALMGGSLIENGDDIDGFRWSQYRLPGGGRAEIIAPVPGSGSDHFLVKYLESRGPNDQDDAADGVSRDPAREPTSGD